MLTNEQMLSIAENVTASVKEAIGRVPDWTRPGNKKGQYYIDLMADQAAVDILSAANFSILSEESGFLPGNNGHVAIIDPLDGSTNASRGLPWYAVSICFVTGLDIQAARVENLALPTVFEALQGGGATKNTQAIRVDGSVDLSKSIVAVSSLPPTPIESWQFRCLGAAALDLSCVAGRSFDAYVDYGDNTHGVWDYLAGLFIAKEAGAIVGEVWDRDLITLDYAARRSPIAASSQSIFTALLSQRRSCSQ